MAPSPPTRSACSSSAPARLSPHGCTASLPRRRWSLGAGGRPPPVRGNARRHWPHSAPAQHTVACTSRAHLEDVRSGFRRGVQAYTTIKHGLMFDRLLAGGDVTASLGAVRRHGGQRCGHVKYNGCGDTSRMQWRTYGDLEFS